MMTNNSMGESEGWEEGAQRELVGWDEGRRENMGKNCSGGR